MLALYHLTRPSMKSVPTCQRKVTGNSAVKFYHDVLASLTEDNAVVLHIIIVTGKQIGRAHV